MEMWFVFRRKTKRQEQSEERVAASQGGREGDGNVVRFSTKNKTTKEVDFGTGGRSLCVFVFQHKTTGALALGQSKSQK
jgi:hypothetical protein